MGDYLVEKKKLKDKMTGIAFLLTIPVVFSFFMFIIGITHQTGEDVIGICFYAVGFVVVLIANKLKEPFYFVSMISICTQLAGSLSALGYEEVIVPIPVLNILTMFLWVKMFKAYKAAKKLDADHFKSE